MNSETMNELVQELTKLFEGTIEPGATQEYVEEQIGGDYLEEITHDEYMEALDKAMENAGVDEATRETVKAQYDDQVDDYGPEGIVEHITIVVNDQDVINEFNQDNSVEVHGDNKAPITQTNDNDVATATAEGAVAGGAGDVQAQTGDGGVQAGHDVNNQHGTIDTDTTTGDGNISADGSTIDGSAFGSGESVVTNTDDNSTNVDADIKDSFDYEDNDSLDATANVDVDVDAGYGEHGYEAPETPVYEEPSYEEHDEPKYEEPKYEEPEADYHADPEPEYHD